MAEQEYWFARRFPVGHPRNAMSPINEGGYAAVRTFVSTMTSGAIAAVVLSFIAFWISQPALYVVAGVVFVAAAIYAGWRFISVATSRGDHNHTVDDYKAGRVQ
jgi:hypothetical protein